MAEPKGKLLLPIFTHGPNQRTQSELSSSLKKLSLHPQSLKSAPKKQSQTVADSWEDEELGASDSELNTTAGPLSPQQSVDYPSAPPPTPISPTSFGSRDHFISPYGYTAGADVAGDARTRRDVRPEKTDAVAKRMIAGALGVKAPKKTEEQKAYEKAIKEKEIKRRNMEKEAAVKAKEEAERAKAAVWDD
jgi:hypothetical protein